MVLALALKYRPKLFCDLVGQETISQTLSMALDKNRIVHAYLFSGLRGSGKTSSARIFARALECEKGPTSTPCGECDICKATLEGRNIDIIEIDAASNRSIDNIRDLIEQTKYVPSVARFKIFIIDEVHMLTKEAFNALLKTLEEPPEYVKFILATTDPLKLPATILSRTQHFRFKKIPQKAVIKHLETILQKEEVGYEQGALEIIARSGGGSLRDTLTLTDQAINYCDRFLTTDQVVKMLGIVDPKNLKDFFASIIHKDDAGLLSSLEALGEYECEMVLDEMLLFLKDALLTNSQDFPLLLIDRFLQILSQSKNLLNLNPDGAFVLLLMGLKMREALKLKDINDAIKEYEAKLAESKDSSEPGESVLDSNMLARANPIQAQPQNTPIPQASQIVQTPQDVQKSDQFAQLVQKIADRSFELGEAFKRSIIFDSYQIQGEHCTLCWHSNPNMQDKALLKQHWNLINTFAKECFAPNGTITIKNLAADKPSPKDSINKTLTTNPDTTMNDTSSTHPNTPESSVSTHTNATQESLNEKQKQSFSIHRTQNHTANGEIIQEYSEDMPWYNDEEIRHILETQQSTPQNTTQLQPPKEQMTAPKEQSNNSSMTATQIFLQENQELIQNLKQNFGVTEMQIIERK